MEGSVVQDFEDAFGRWKIDPDFTGDNQGVFRCPTRVD